MSQPTQLTAKELQVLESLFSEMRDIPDIDWESFSRKVGQKYEKNAKALVRKLIVKLTGTTPSSGRGKSTQGVSKKPAAAATKGAAKPRTPKSASKQQQQQGKQMQQVESDNDSDDEEDVKDVKPIIKDEDGSGESGKSSPDSSMRTSPPSSGPELQDENDPAFVRDSYYANLNFMSLLDYRKERDTLGHDFGADFAVEEVEKVPTEPVRHRTTLSPLQEQLNHGEIEIVDEEDEV